MSYNIAQIMGQAQKYGVSGIDNQQAQNLMNQFGGGDEGQIDNYFQQQQTKNNAISQYNQQTGSAVSGLQNQQSNLAGQYGSLLDTVKGEYQPLINQATMQQNQQNASRGLVSDVGNGGTQMLSALNPIYSAQAGNAQQLGAGSIADMNTLQQAIANTQMTGAAGAANLPLEYGSLQMNQSALPSQIALAQAQARLAGNQANAAQYLPNYNGITFNAGNGQANVLGQGLNLSSATLQAALRSMGL